MNSADFVIHIRNPESPLYQARLEDGRDIWCCSAMCGAADPGFMMASDWEEACSRMYWFRESGQLVDACHQCNFAAVCERYENRPNQDEYWNRHWGKTKDALESGIDWCLSDEVFDTSSGKHRVKVLAIPMGPQGQEELLIRHWHDFSNKEEWCGCHRYASRDILLKRDVLDRLSIIINTLKNRKVKK